jgi:hypothetical protein
MHVAEQPSPVIVLWSSHCSPSSRTPSPHRGYLISATRHTSSRFQPPNWFEESEVSVHRTWAVPPVMYGVRSTSWNRHSRSVWLSVACGVSAFCHAVWPLTSIVAASYVRSSTVSHRQYWRWTFA